jgi:hypothetical protein
MGVGHRLRESAGESVREVSVQDAVRNAQIGSLSRPCTNAEEASNSAVWGVTDVAVDGGSLKYRKEGLQNVLNGGRVRRLKDSEMV